MIEYIFTLGLASFSVSYLLTMTAGPFGIIKKTRQMLEPLGILECAICTSVWVAVLLSIISNASAHGQFANTVMAGIGLTTLIFEYLKNISNKALV